MVAFFQGEIYFPGVLSSALREVVQLSSFVSAIYFWFRDMRGLQLNRSSNEITFGSVGSGRVRFLQQAAKCIHLIFWGS